MAEERKRWRWRLWSVRLLKDPAQDPKERVIEIREGRIEREPEVIGSSARIGIGQDWPIEIVVAEVKAAVAQAPKRPLDLCV